MNEVRRRRISLSRQTRETNIELTVDLDAGPLAEVSTGIGFFDHMLSTLAFHAGWSMTLKADGDLAVDDHHTVEDCALILGQALDSTLGDRADIRRFGHAYAPLDESLARAVVDLVTRPYAEIQLGLQRETIGSLSAENIPHFFRALATSGRFTLHLDVLRGSNDHHRTESAFKALALALRRAAQTTGGNNSLSTKGRL